AAALGGLAAACPVVHAATDEVVQPWQVQPAPIHPRRREHDGGPDLDAAFDVKVDLLLRVVQAAADRAAQDHDLGAELLRLAPCLPRELGAPDPVREAEEVLDHRGM